MSETVSPRELDKEGKAAYKRGDFLAAAQAFEAAGKAYTEADDKLSAAEAANNCSVAYLQADEAKAALEVVEGTAEVFAAAGDVRRQAMALGNQGAALEELDRLEEAGEAYQQSADLLKQIGDEDLYVSVMKSLSALQFRMGKQLQALATMQSGLEEVEKPSIQQRMTKRLLDIPFSMFNKGRDTDQEQDQVQEQDQQ